MGPAKEKVTVFGGKRTIRERFDGFVNFVTALGTSRDKMAYTSFVRSRQLAREELDALYSENDIAARVCDVVPDEELRQGFKIVVAPDTDMEGGGEQAIDDASTVAEAVQDAADALQLTKKMIEARVWGRVFGGGVMLLGVDDGATVENEGLIEAINEKKITAFDHINVLDRQFVHPVEFYTDPTDPKFAQPRVYLVTPKASESVSASHVLSQATIRIHETRLVIFGGARTTILTRQENSGWDTSIIQRMNTILQQTGTSWDSLAHMLSDSAQGVFKMEGLLDALASGDIDLVMQRLDVMDMARSTVRAVVLDAEGESFERQDFDWTGIKEPFQIMMLRLASAARMPLTVLMGQSPAGLNATGESDIRWFYDTIRSSQKNIIEPALRYILRLMMLSKSGPTDGQVPDSWSISFPSLWQMTPIEQADVELKTAQKDEIYLEQKVVMPEEVAVSRFTADGWSADTMINLEERRIVLEGGDLDVDIEDTPTLGPDGEPVADDVPRTALAGGQTAQLIDLATKVQNGTLDRESAIAIVLAAYPSMSPEEAAAAVGDIDPAKVAARATLAAGLAGGPGNTGHEEEEENEDHFDRIEKRGSEYVLVSGAGKVLGTHDSKAKAEEQERAIKAAENE